MISNMLKWRDANNVDDIRQDIVYGGKDTPLKFPFGKTIIDIVPQIIITANSTDKLGRPLGGTNITTFLYTIQILTPFFVYFSYGDV